ncbi:MAG: hypothetical protein OZ921_05595 [Sorangiineae bacterium]|nr:hypothetical protein [Sorangiineae bacterium]
MRRSWFGVGLALGAAMVFSSSAARAQEGAEPSGAAAAESPSADPDVAATQGWSAQADTGAQPGGGQGGAKQPEKLAWRGTTFSLDQSLNTQELGVGADYLSRDPTYEMSWSLRPRYYLYDDDTDSVNVNARFDLYQELTNSDSTTREREPLFGDVWLNGVWGHKLYVDKKAGYLTALQLGPRFIFGTSKASRGRGMVMQLGAGGGLNQTVPLAGPTADFFPSISFTGSAFYMKALDRCTTACNSSFEYTRQDTGGRTLLSDQLSGGAMVSHQVTAVLGADTSITDKLTLGLSYVWILQWTHDVGSQPADVTTATGTATPAGIDSPTRHRVMPWLTAEVDYDLFDEVALALGYYNATSQVGPDGTRRSPLWSPDARFFFTITANLDEIYKLAAGQKSKSATAKPAASAPPVAFGGNSPFGAF